MFTTCFCCPQVAKTTQFGQFGVLRKCNSMATKHLLMKIMGYDESLATKQTLY